MVDIINTLYPTSEQGDRTDTMGMEGPPLFRSFIHILDNLKSRLPLRPVRAGHGEDNPERGPTPLIEALRHARLAAGLTQTDLADRLQCHQSLVARIESGERRVDVVELIVLARAIGVSTASVLKMVEKKTPTNHRI